MYSARNPADGPSRRLYLVAMGGLLAGLLALVVITSVSTYRMVRTRVEHELEQRLLSIGETIAQNLGGAGAAPTTRGDSLLWLDGVRKDLRRIAAANDLGGIEVIDARRRHLVGTDSTLVLGEIHPLLSVQPEVAAAIAGIPVATSLYEVPELRGVFFKTGFVPIEDADGVIRGIVAVEGGSGFFEILPSLRRTWWATGLASALIAAVLAIFLMGVFRALERSERSMQASAALASAGQLAAIVAHEIRNPLAALLSRAERAQDELEAGVEPRRVAELLEAIPIEVRRLDRILTNYLSLARASGDGGSCQVSRIVEETIDLLSKELARTGVAVSVQVSAADARARIGSGSLRQALLNLFLNARDAMPGGGELRVRVGAGSAVVTIEVEDTGTGIDPSARMRIFEPFFTTRPTGSGLGLAVVESVVRGCAGRIEVRSTPGKGTAFLLTLPRDAIGETNARASGAVPDPAGRG
jgi:signal transduction histidine kinase